MGTEFQDIVGEMEPLLHKLQESPLLTRDKLHCVPDRGVYVFYEEGKPKYVGRSNDLRKRIKGHVAPNAGATFAFKLLRKKLAIKADYSPENSKATLLRRYPKEFREQLEKVRNMTFQVVAIEDQQVQYIFEAYAIISLGTTEFNSFETT